MKKFIQNNNNLAIAYYRYSSHSQNEASIEWQRNLAEEYARTHDLIIVKEYSDEALSGRDETRAQYRLMLSEIKSIKPAFLILYKTDRLARDRYELTVSRRLIRDSGCEIAYTAEPNLDSSQPVSVFLEGALDAMAEFYSLNLSQNVLNGLMHNAHNGLYNGNKMLGYAVDATKHYIIDDATAPVVLRIFNQYADGIGIKEIVNSLNSQGIKTSRGNNFTINSIRGILHNRAYIGEYSYNGVVIPGGMPRIVSDELFEAAQRQFDLNKHRPKPVDSSDMEPRFWLTGKLFCGHCKAPMHGVSGTSKTGKKHYYYACANYRKHKCKLKYINQDFIENYVLSVLRDFLSDEEMLISLAADVSAYAKKIHSDDTFLKSLQSEYKKTEKELENVVNAVKQGCYSQSIQKALEELETKQQALSDAIESEKVKLSLSNDEYSIKHYFEMYRNADFSDVSTRDNIFNYFIDKIFVFDDKIVIDLYYSDNHIEISIDEFIAQMEYARDSVQEECDMLHPIRSTLTGTTGPDEGCDL